MIRSDVDTLFLVSGKALSAGAQTIQFLYFLTNALLFHRRQIIDKQLTDQVIHLMLDANCQQVIGLEFERFAVTIERANFDLFCARYQSALFWY
jgi:hypothetical protein